MEDLWGNIISPPCLHNPNPRTKSPSFHDFFNSKHPYLDDPTLLLPPHRHPSNTQMPSLSKKRASSPDSAGERRRKRLIKNRESADRSRARRMAYTNELEQEIEDLKRENASLRAQLKEGKPRPHQEKAGGISSTAAATNQKLHSTKGNSLCRTLTAPF
ncbi:hypothetical protein DCAR_0623092 [Daucus carota subsp. sativus]|uniref:BZIP domain-containing protein n=1 Tax=Daucus carota subsp. sativus TaxID=79200 RepID=A0AAF0X924_DAUCS|nr:PREDICTED: bZIP transcription factor 27-like [Daucus carota subsp. sativus]WOH03693.1 hypothetical protein DCAR_0623092 [Daucus carota subsp. sativus]